MKDDGTEKLRFDGHFALADGSVSRFSVAGSFRENDFTTLGLEIFWHGELAERQKGLAAFMNNEMNNLWIPNDDPYRGHVELLGLAGYSTEFAGTTAISTVPLFSSIQCGIHRDIEPNDRELYVAVRLVPSGLLSAGIHEQHYTGELKIQPLSNSNPIHVETKFGQLLVSETFNFESHVEFGNEVTKRIPLTTISGKIIVPHGASLYEVHEKLFGELEAIRVALCLCYRQSVRIVQITYRDPEDRQRSPAYYRRKLSETKAKVKVENFINCRSLGNGGLQRLAEAIRAMPNSADLIRAIEFLATSYENDLETAFFMAFSAMETVINLSIGTMPGLGYSASDWKAIRRAAELTLRKVAEELRIDPADLLEKLPELKRPSFRRRLSLACTALKPATDDLWPGRDFLDGMAEAASIRNGLFHAAEYSDGDALSDSLIRVRTFAERLIAKLLRWPDQGLWAHRDSDLRFLNRAIATNASTKPD